MNKIANTQPGSGQMVLILGGARSGKSTFAEECAGSYENVLYFATARIPDGDSEMRERIHTHRQRRPKSWHTMEPPATFADLTKKCEQLRPGAVIIDCLTLWLGWELTRTFNQYSRQQLITHFDTEFAHIAATLRSLPCPVFAVSNETGCGVVPDHRSGRIFRDLQGILNARLVQESALSLLSMGGKALLIHEAKTKNADYCPVASVSAKWVREALL